MIVVRENKGGAYTLAELTGAVWHRKVAKFRVVPYFARKSLNIPNGVMSIIDTDETGLDSIEAQKDESTILTRDYLMDDVRMNSDDLEENIIDTNDIFE